MKYITLICLFLIAILGTFHTLQGQDTDESSSSDFPSYFEHDSIQFDDESSSNPPDEKSLIEKAEKKLGKLFSKKKMKKTGEKLKEMLTEEKAAEIGSKILDSSLSENQKQALFEALEKAKNQLDQMSQED